MQELFSKGKSLTVFPVKVFYMQPGKQQDNVVKAGVGTSKRNFKKAVDRNRIKRLLREIYRMEKIPLQEYLKSSSKQITIFFLYVDKSMPEYAELKTKMHLALHKLIKQLNEETAANT